MAFQRYGHIGEEPQRFDAPPWVHFLVAVAVLIAGIVGAYLFLGTLLGGLIAGTGVLALLGWLLTTYRHPAPQDLLPLYLIAVAALLLHSLEAWAGNYPAVLKLFFPLVFAPPVRFTTEGYAIAFILGATTLSLFGALGIWLRHPLGNALLWLVLAWSVVTAAAQPVLGLVATGRLVYVPGMATALGPFVIGGLGLQRLVGNVLLGEPAPSRRIATVHRRASQRPSAVPVETQVYAGVSGGLITAYGLAVYTQAGAWPGVVAAGVGTAALGGWMLTTARFAPGPAQVLPVYLTTVALLTAHVFEAYLLGFPLRLGASTGRPWSPDDFLVLAGVSLPVAWCVGGVLIYARNPLGQWMAWFVYLSAVAQALLLGSLFPALGEARLTYVPGFYTSLLAAVTGFWGLHGLWSSYRLERRRVEGRWETNYA